MSNRYIPYGYKFESGQPVPHPVESEIVREIFERYCAGDSLKVIAEGLTSRRVEYSPGKASWDKARIKRILENARYIGESDYPAIIEKEQFVAANLKKETTNTNKLVIDEDIKLFKEMTVCTKCGRKIIRRTDSRFAEPISWKCTECGYVVRMSDETFKTQVIALMNMLITTPQMVPETEQPTEVYSIESKRLVNEFHRAMDSKQSSEDELIKLVMQIGAANYQAMDSRRAITARLAADFGKAELQNTFQRPLFQRTVRRIQLSPDGTLSLELQNRRIVPERTDQP